MLKAGCPAKVCAKCGAPWVREVETVAAERPGLDRQQPGRTGAGRGRGNGDLGSLSRTTTGWSPTCDHDAGTAAGVVLDPFIGSGTVAQVAQEHGRRWVGIDLDPRNADLVHKRTRQQSLIGLDR